MYGAHKHALTLCPSQFCGQTSRRLLQSGRSLLASASTSGGNSNSEGVITHGFTVDAGTDTLHATEADGSTDDTAVVGMAIAIPIGLVALGA